MVTIKPKIKARAKVIPIAPIIQERELGQRAGRKGRSRSRKPLIIKAACWSFRPGRYLPAA